MTGNSLADIHLAVSQKIHQSFLEIAGDLSPILADAIGKVGPVRLRKRKKTPLAETLCRAVAGQQLSTKAASTIWGRVLELADEAALVDFLSSSSIQDLRSCGLSESKCKAMQAIARASEEGLLDVDTLRRLDHGDRSRRLTSIWGVGQWTSDMIGIFYFADPDVWPDGDVTVGKTLERLTSRRRKTANTARRFAPYRSYLALYMYQVADSDALK